MNPFRARLVERAGEYCSEPDEAELAAIHRSSETGLPYGERSWTDRLCRRQQRRRRDQWAAAINAPLQAQKYFAPIFHPRRGLLLPQVVPVGEVDHCAALPVGSLLRVEPYDHGVP